MSPEKKPDTRKKRAAFDVQRGNVFLFPPEDLTIVEDEKHALFDERSALPPTERMIRSIMSKGVVEPIIVRKEGDQAIVVDGRQRVRAALEANKRLEKEGDDPVLVPAVIRKGDESDAMDVMVSLNEIRVDDDLVIKAKKAARLLQRGRSEQQVAEAFGVSTSTIGNWVTLLELAAPVQAKVSEGRIRVLDAVRELAKLPKGEQLAAAEMMEEVRPTRAANKADGKRKPDGPRVLAPAARVKKLARFLETDAAALNRREQVLVSWLLGNEKDSVLVEQFGRLEKFVEGLR